MDRFVALIWDQDDQSRLWQVDGWSVTLQRQSPKWVRVLDAPGLRVFSYHHRGDGPVVTRWHGETGIVIGTLFERGEERKGRVLSIDRRGAAEVVTTRGGTLISNYWGNYVAIWRDAKSRQTVLLRDPCGAVPCFMAQQRGIELVFAHVDDVTHLPGVEFSIDWNYLSAYLVFNHFITKYTGLSNVVEVLAGELFSFAQDGRPERRWLWHGVEVAERKPFRNFDEARQAIRNTSEECFQAWGGEYRRIVASLSGGLDSSVLVCLLRQVSNADVVGLHYLGVGYERYEVALARDAAAQARIRLVEAVQDVSKDDLRVILQGPLLARPKVQVIAVLVDRLARDLADEVGADCYMIGQGGDNLFLQRGGAKHTLLDYVQVEGFRREFLRTAYGAAMLQRDSVWRAISDALRVNNDAWDPYGFLNDRDRARTRPFATEAVSAIPEEYRLHPWLRESRRLPRGKAHHLVNIVALNNYYVHHGRGVNRDVVYPFVSQPMVEAVLRTPTYLLCRDGQDRALERAAFADIIPQSVRMRTGKGGADHYLLQMMRRNIAFFREMILDGAMLQHGVLDRTKVERMLSDEFIVSGNGVSYIYPLVAIEAWLSTWRDAQRAAA